MKWNLKINIKNYIGDGRYLKKLNIKNKNKDKKKVVVRRVKCISKKDIIKNIINVKKIKIVTIIV